jgi:4-phosphopantoate--beta-alanine ligase
MEHEEIPKSHPRYHSIIIRERLVDGFRKGMVVPQGLIAHGRGEAFDYILGEKTHAFALEAERAAVAGLLLASKPAISVNGNYAALAADEIASLAEATGAIVEVNLFYRTEERVRRIYEHLRDHGVPNLMPPDCEKTRIPGLESRRGIVCVEGLYQADFVLLAIEDGDRTEAFKSTGKMIAAIDLNPFSRTAQKADITIVDEAIRATREMARIAGELRRLPRGDIERILEGYDNARILKAAFATMLERLSYAAEKGVL